MLNSVLTYITGLTVTSTPVVAFGDSFVFGTNCFVLTFPNLPANAVFISPLGGGKPSTVNKSKTPGMQLMVRHINSQDGYSTADAFNTLLHNNPNVINGMCYADNSIPYSLGIDETGNQLFTVNFRFLEITT